MKRYKNALSVRGDSVYCPLAFSLDAYWNCLTDCWHCYFRKLNRVWGTDLRPADPETVDRQLHNGVKNLHPKTPLAHCLRKKKTIRFGNKSDAFQDAENQYRVSRELLKILEKHEWTYLVQTRFPSKIWEYRELVSVNHMSLMPVISPGLDIDWEILERKRTDPPLQRLQIAKRFIRKGFNVGVNGEPFIPGFHTVDQFEDTIKLIKDYRIPSYNTYNFHFNDFVAKRLHAIGIDIERIWYYNRDQYWRPILQQLLDIAKKHDVRLGCPDFVNTGMAWEEKANTCCGLNVSNPTTYNTHFFKKLKQLGYSKEDIFEETWDGSGEEEMGKKVIEGTTDKFYTLKDAEQA